MITSSGSVHSVNWPDIERRAIVKSITQNGHSPDGVGAVICKYSPGASSMEKQQGILEDIERLAPDLQAQYAKTHGDRGSAP